MRRSSLFLAVLAVLPSSGWAAPAAGQLACDESMKTAFVPDALTTVVLVKAFKKGDPLVLSESVTAQTPKAANDVCLVKLNVGPGNPGPPDAPSTSAGIGMEIWLPTPANWNNRMHALGSGGWSGGPAGSPKQIANPTAAVVAGTEGAVSSVTDNGHSGFIAGIPTSTAAFAMNPDGTANKVLWKDFSTRSLHEQAVKTKALAAAYYGRPPKHSYFEGQSLGGRQGHNLAQNFPADYDGITANMPAINWTRFFTGSFYSQIVIQRDLGGVPWTEAQQDLVSNAAIHACDVVGGQHLGYIMDEATCRYDPTEDPYVLCKNDGGKNTTPDCVTKVQANAINKIWYGTTSDGSVPSPATDNGWDKELEGVRRWYGVPRGTTLYNAFFRKLFGVALGGTNIGGGGGGSGDMVALELQNPTIAGPDFKNASGDGQALWKTLSYVQFSNAIDRGVALQSVFDYINSDNPDLSAFKARGGKLLFWHGASDGIIPPQGSIQYYNRVIEKMGGLPAVQSFYRFYLVPGIGHGGMNGTSNPDANPPMVGPTQFYDLLVNWVEKGVAPDRIEIESPATAVRISQPICPYPKKATYVGGDPHVTTSFKCS